MNFKIFAFLVLATVLIVCKQSSAKPQVPSMPDPSSFAGAFSDPSKIPKEMAEQAEAAKGFKDMAASSIPAPGF